MSMDNERYEAAARALSPQFGEAFETMMRAVRARPDVSARAMVPPPSAMSAGRSEALAKDQVAAALAGGIIAASGKPHTVAEALDVMREVRTALYPAT